MGIDYLSATTKNELDEKEISYKQLNAGMLKEYLIIINATPLGTFPKVDSCPELSYEFVTPDHIFYDLVYNPAETLFLKKGKQQGAKIKNGLEMLHLQALKSWEIWNS
jgi:shikimate dehydrogenase